MEMNKYLETVSGEIRSRKAKAFVTEELKSHIEDQKFAYMAEGMSMEEAEEEAVRQMGDPMEVGRQMNQIHRPKMEWKMLAALVALALLGSLIWGNPHHAIWAGIGLATALLLCFVDYTRIEKLSIPLAMVILLAIAATSPHIPIFR